MESSISQMSYQHKAQAKALPQHWNEAPHHQKMSKQHISTNFFSKTSQTTPRRNKQQHQKSTDISRTKNSTKSHTLNASSKSKTSNKQVEKDPHNNYSLNLIINNVAGLGVLTGKMDNILQWIDTNQIDTFLGQEANVSFRNPRIQCSMLRFIEEKL